MWKLGISGLLTPMVVVFTFAGSEQHEIQERFAQGSCEWILEASVPRLFLKPTLECYGGSSPRTHHRGEATGVPTLHMARVSHQRI